MDLKSGRTPLFLFVSTVRTESINSSRDKFEITFSIFGTTFLRKRSFSMILKGSCPWHGIDNIPWKLTCYETYILNVFFARCC
jgi:hypothetical protein